MRFLVAAVGALALAACVSDIGLHDVGAPDERGLQAVSAQMDAGPNGVVGLGIRDESGRIVAWSVAPVQSLGEVIGFAAAGVGGAAAGGYVGGKVAARGLLSGLGVP